MTHTMNNVTMTEMCEFQENVNLSCCQRHNGDPSVVACNTSVLDEPEEFQHVSTFLVVGVTLLNCVIFCVGVFGNTLVIVVVCRVRAMRNPTNYFLFALSIADLCVLLICQPVALMEFYAMNRWYIGATMCKLAPLLEHGMLHGSILMMTAMTVERFYAIVYPFKTLANSNDRFTIKVITVLWIVAFICTSPFLLITHLQEALFFDGSVVMVCQSLVYLPWHKVFIMTNIVLFFVLPFIVLVCMYSLIIRQLMSDSLMILANNDRGSRLTHTSRKQVVRMLIFIIILFFVSMCPIRVVTLWQIFTPLETIDKLGIEAYYNIIWFARIMMYINSAGNPVIYSMTSTKFKIAFKRVLQRCNPCKRFDYHGVSSSTTRVMYRRSNKPNNAVSLGNMKASNSGVLRHSQSSNESNVKANDLVIQMQ